MTKGDFYIGSGLEARWIGSITHDAFPDVIPCDIITAINHIMFEEKVIEFLEADPTGSIIPSGGDSWPWPWNDSHITDYVYMFDFERSKVVASHYGSPFFDPLKIRQGEDLKYSTLEDAPPKFPIMSMEINRDGSYIT